MRRFGSKSFWLFVVTASFCAALARADLPELSYIFPAGGQRGATIECRVGGLYLTESCRLEVLGDGVKLNGSPRPTKTLWFEGPLLPLGASQQQEDYPKDWSATVAIGADARFGSYYWRASTSQGVAPMKRFVVGELPEIVEQEIEGDPIPVTVALPATINGRTFPREDVDLWSFLAKRGQTIRCEVVAARLGSPVDSQLEILDSSGRRLAANGDFYGADSYLEFTAPADGTYTARIYDIAFGGLQDYVYRLTLSTDPYVTTIYPLGAKRGAKTKFALTGVGVSSSPVEIEIPNDAPKEYAHRFSINGKLTNPVMIEVDDKPEQDEHATNDESAQAAPASVPAIFNGRIESPGDIDYWAFGAKKGEVYDIEVRANRLGSPLDSVLVVGDASGKELARNDDLTGDQPDSQLRFAAPADGIYYVRVEERLHSRGGPAFAYRLHIDHDRGPDFRLTLSADACTVNRGADARFKLNVNRLGGFNEEIEVAVDNLPQGVTVTGAKIGKNQPQTFVVFKADAAAPVCLTDVVVRGAAQIAGKTVEQIATLPVARGEPPVEKLALAVAMPTPFKIVGVFETRFAPRGSTQTRRYKIERGGYEGPLEIRLADKQSRHLQGVVGRSITVPKGADEFEYPIYLPPWMDLGRTSRTCVMASADVPDEAGTKHRVSFTSLNQNEQIIFLVSPSLLSLRTDRTSLLAKPQETAEVRCEIERDKSLSGAVKLELIVPAHIHGVAAEPVTLPAGEQKASLIVRFGAASGPFNMPLAVRASTTTTPAQVTETPLEVVVGQ